VETYGKETKWKTRLRWKCNIKMDLQEVGRSAMDWIELDQIVDRWLALVNAVMKFRGSIKCVDFFLTNSESVSCSRRTRLYSLI